MAYLMWILFVFAVVAEVPSISDARGPQSKSEFCYHVSRDPDYFLKLAYDPENRLSFANKGGLLDGGVCWWHSLFQRSTLYLAVFKPHESKPHLQEAKSIIYRLSHLSGVVEIPGYSDLHSFSLDWSGEIQHALELWQARDGFIYQKWIGNVTRTTHLPPDELRQNMRTLWDEVENKKHVTWTMLKLPGILAHAWLVLHLVDDAYSLRLEVIDSNHPDTTLTVRHRDGDTSIRSRSGETVPYVLRTNDFNRFASAQRNYCGQ